MKILQKKKIKPINLLPNDSIVLSYVDEFGKRTKLLEHTTNKTMTVDECAVFEMEQKELDKFGYRDAIGGWFAETK